jgi:hypothetical protein
MQFPDFCNSGGPDGRDVQAGLTDRWSIGFLVFPVCGDGHRAAWSSRSTEKSNGLIENPSRYLPPCSIVSQPTALPLTPSTIVWLLYYYIRRNFRRFITDSFWANIFYETIRIHWQPTFQNATFATTVCSMFTSFLAPPLFPSKPQHTWPGQASTAGSSAKHWSCCSGFSIVPHVSGEPVDQMKLKEIFAFNLVAVIATVLSFVTFQAKVTAIALDNTHTVSIKRKYIHVHSS